ncbi:MAG: hypothetical protein K0R18_311 [Bacillales bacterium]|jgi:hypothetical protein|nr:hypothetical protein [Bacillales bacterium]
MRNEVIITDDEATGLDEIFRKHLTFDLVCPIEMRGQIGNHRAEVTFIMSNGDKVEYYYDEAPDYRRIPTHMIVINGEFERNEADHDPAIFLHAMYRQHLAALIRR